jgi:hypothetical protein
MDVACSMHGWDEKCKCNFNSKARVEGTTWNIGLDWWILLKCVSKEQVVMVLMIGVEFIQLGIGNSGGLSATQK